MELRARAASSFGRHRHAISATSKALFGWYAHKIAPSARNHTGCKYTIQSEHDNLIDN